MRTPISPASQSLLDAAFDLDPHRIRSALKAGADVNALGIAGEDSIEILEYPALYVLFQARGNVHYSSREIRERITPARIACAEILLDTAGVEPDQLTRDLGEDALEALNWPQTRATSYSEDLTEGLLVYETPFDALCTMLLAQKDATLLPAEVTLVNLFLNDARIDPSRSNWGRVQGTMVPEWSALSTCTMDHLDAPLPLQFMQMIIESGKLRISSREYSDILENLDSGKAPNASESKALIEASRHRITAGKERGWRGIA